MIRGKAKEVFGEVEDAGRAVFKASRGWLDRFMARNGLSVRRRTTVAQKTPDMMTEKNGFIHSLHGACPGKE
jgi:hypothetical protein